MENLPKFDNRPPLGIDFVKNSREFSSKMKPSIQGATALDYESPFVSAMLQVQEEEMAVGKMAG